MKYIYLDESGNLGFTEKSGTYFVVASLCVDSEKTVHRCIKNARTGLNSKYKKNELKFSNSSNANRRRVLQCISRRDISLSCLVLNKNWVPMGFTAEHTKTSYIYDRTVIKPYSE